jgi:release factor glutamine methyltransferase
VSWQELTERARAELENAGRPNAENEARWIVEQASGLRGAELVAAEHESATSLATRRVQEMLRRRISGEPLQYVLGEWSFRGIDLFVDPRVLIPRPETEMTAQVAIDEASAAGARRGGHDTWVGAREDFTVVDLGTGSGALAIALASELPDAEVWATDSSADALAVARANVAGTAGAATRIRLVEGDWFAALPTQLHGHVDLVVSNPPYVAVHEVADLPPEVTSYEPHAALVSGPTGLEAIERILGDAGEWLSVNGRLVIEIAPHQSDQATAFAEGRGFRAEVRRDLAGRDRVLTARLR